MGAADGLLDPDIDDDEADVGEEELSEAEPDEVLELAMVEEVEVSDSDVVVVEDFVTGSGLGVLFGGGGGFDEGGGGGGSFLGGGGSFGGGGGGGGFAPA